MTVIEWFLSQTQACPSCIKSVSDEREMVRVAHSECEWVWLCCEWAKSEWLRDTDRAGMGGLLGFASISIIILSKLRLIYKVQYHISLSATPYLYTWGRLNTLQVCVGLACLSSWEEAIDEWDWQIGQLQFRLVNQFLLGVNIYEVGATVTRAI